MEAPGVVATELGIELAARGHEIHFITSSRALPAHRPRSQHSLPPGGDLPLPALRAPALRSRARHAHGGGRRVLLARSSARALRHPALRLRLPGQADARYARGIHLPFITTLHGTDITLVGLDRSYLPITKLRHRAIRRRHRDLSPISRPHPRGISPLKSRSKSSATSSTATSTRPQPELIAEMRPRYAAPNEKAYSCTFRTSAPSSASAMWLRSLPRSPAGPARPPDAHRRRARPLDRRVPRAQARRAGSRSLSGQAGQRQRASAGRRPHAHAVRDGVLRPGRARSHGLPGARHRDPRGRRAGAHRSPASTACSARSAMSTAWLQAAITALLQE